MISLEATCITATNLKFVQDYLEVKYTTKLSTEYFLQNTKEQRKFLSCLKTTESIGKF